MSGQSAIFHALLRPVVLQILRATGYHSTKGAVLDTLTDMAARYMSTLCETTAAHAIHNHGDAGDYTVVDVRIALQDVGALQPDKLVTEQRWKGEEDMRGVEEFLQWFSGARMKELMEMGKGDGESDATDYLSGESALGPPLSPDSRTRRHADFVCPDSLDEEAQQDGRRHQVARHHPRQAPRHGERGPGRGRARHEHRGMDHAAQRRVLRPAAPRGSPRADKRWRPPIAVRQLRP